MRKIFLQLVVLVPIIAFGIFLFKNISPSALQQVGSQVSSNLDTLRKFEVSPDFTLKGEGENIEAPEFYGTEEPESTLLFVSGKTSESLEIWQFPFKDTKEQIFKRESSPNGLLVDQEANLLFIADIDRNLVEAFTLPDLNLQAVIGEEVLKSGENNLGLITLPDGKKRLYVTDEETVFGFNLENGTAEVRFVPEVDSIEEIVADSFHQIIYVPDEAGVRSHKNKDGVILAFHPDGKPYQKNGSNQLGEGLYTGDAEGIEIYRCLDDSKQDTGRGFILSVDQSPNENNAIEIFNRESWEHRGTLFLEGVIQTDGIDVHELSLPNYPQGLLAVSDNDASIAIVDWAKISETMDLQCE